METKGIKKVKKRRGDQKRTARRRKYHDDKYTDHSTEQIAMIKFPPFQRFENDLKNSIQQNCLDRLHEIEDYLYHLTYLNLYRKFISLSRILSTPYCQDNLISLEKVKSYTHKITEDNWYSTLYRWISGPYEIRDNEKINILEEIDFQDIFIFRRYRIIPPPLTNDNIINGFISGPAMERPMFIAPHYPLKLKDDFCSIKQVLDLIGDELRKNNFYNDNLIAIILKYWDSTKWVCYNDLECEDKDWDYGGGGEDKMIVGESLAYSYHNDQSNLNCLINDLEFIENLICEIIDNS